MNIDIEGLKIFVMAASCLNFTKAAQLLFTTQSTVSRRIAQIEKDVGAKLFMRTSMGIALTKPGEKFLEEARRIIAQIDELPLKLSKCDHSSMSGKVRIAHYGLSDIAMIFDVIAETKLRAPDIIIEGYERLYAPQVEGLLRNEFDIIIGIDSEIPPLENIEVQRLQRAELHAVVTREHRLAQKREISIRDLEGESLVWWSRFHAPVIYDRVNQACADQGFVPAVAQAGGTVCETLYAIAAGQGVGLFVGRGESGRLGKSGKALPIIDMPHPLYYCAAYLKENENPCIRLVWDILREMAEEQE